jgi:hypothetical protein
MPYKIVKVKGGYKVQNAVNKDFYSSYALTKEMAMRQKLALEISEGKRMGR